MALTNVLLAPEPTENADNLQQFLKRKTAGTQKKATVRVSIITVTYNSEATIKDTLESVKNQSYSNIEHILVDGNSKDRTVEIIKSYPHVSKCISERDMGLYDAMNKGLQLATGDVIGILNSDDFYAENDVIQKVAELFERENPDTIYGDLDYVDPVEVNKVIRKWRSGNFNRSKFWYGWMPPHPTFFVKREVYEQVGLFNISLRSAADYELMLRILFKYQYNSSYLPNVLVKMRAGGVSNSSLKRRINANKEDRLAWKMNNLHPYFFTLYLKPLRKVFQFKNPFPRLQL